MQVQRPILTQQQKLKLSPQLYQSVQLMALPLVDLRQRIAEEIEANPALELIRDDTPVSLDEAPPADANREQEFFQNDVGYEPSYEAPRTGGYDFEGMESNHGFIEGAVSRQSSLQDHLLEQLRLQPISDRLFTAAELLIHSLDDDGFLREPLTEVLPAELHSYIPRAQEVVSHLDPIGTGVADYRESLLVQLSCLEGVPAQAAEIIRSYLDQVQKMKFSEIARKLRCSEETVEQAVEAIKTLNPFPGRLYSVEMPRYIVPDVSIENLNGELVIVMNDEVIPVLGVNDLFSDIGKSGKREDRAFVNNYVRSARWFITSIEIRNQTLFKVARAVVDFQRDFFFRGPKHLRPLTLREVANEIGVHETTVSRITTAKYVQTEWGIYELKHFFSSAVGGDMSAFSKEGVKQILKEILQEAGSERLSDQKLSDLLKKRGISLARRTVAKYRKELDIDSSYGR